MRVVSDVGDCASSGGGGGVPVAQAFIYVATGAEGDTFTITLPVAQPDVNYIANVSGGGLSFFILWDAPRVSYTVNNFVLKTSAPVVAGDTFNILIVERTA